MVPGDGGVEVQGLGNCFGYGSDAGTEMVTGAGYKIC